MFDVQLHQPGTAVEASTLNESRQDCSGVRVISRAIDILRSLENCPEGLSLGEISKAIALPRSTVQRIVATLSNEGLLIAASPTAKVRLGPTILQLASSLDFDITKIMRPFLRDLSLDVNETVDLSVQRGGSVAFVDQIVGNHRLVARSAIGERFPLHCTANGKALLAALPHEAAEKGLERSLREYPRSPAFDADKFWREIETIRSEFVAFDREQHASGISAIGTAIGDPNGGFVAISIPVPTARFSRNEARLVERLLVNRKHIISKLSGSRPTVS